MNRTYNQRRGRRRARLLGLVTSAGALALIAACGSSGSSGGTAASNTNTNNTSGSGSSGSASKSPIVLAYVAGVSGANGAVGVDSLAGSETAAAEINAAGGVDGGHPIQIVTYDTKGDPSQAVLETRDAIAAGHLLIIGPWNSPECLAIAPVVYHAGGLVIDASCTADEETGTKPIEPDYYSVTDTDHESATAEAAFIKDVFPAVNSFDYVGYNYIVAQEGLQLELQLAKGIGDPLTPGREYTVPLNTEDFSTAITGLAQSETKATPNKMFLLGTFGDGDTGFLLQSAPYHFLQNYAGILAGGGYFTSALAMKGDAPPVWDIYAYEYQAAVDPSVNNSFVSEYEKLNPSDGPPNDWSFQGWTAVEEYAAAMNKAMSTTPSAIQAALGGLTIQSPMGPITMDAALHRVDINMLVFETVGDKSSQYGVKLLKWDAINAFTDKIVASGS
jgi:branched-chain amino acid transport system substrate-binding protein